MARFQYQNLLRSVLDPGSDTLHDLLLNIDGIPQRLHADVSIDLGKFRDVMHHYSDTNDPEPDVYFYHSDHLGSASWITDADGNPVQHLQYLPYGEPYINQRVSGYNERFTFTGKERDEETGYGYFGARYMDHELMTMWLSVDPMMDKYPSVSPYNYCMWNSIKLVDPQGEEAVVSDDKWQFNTSTGRLTWINNEGGLSHQTVDMVHDEGGKLVTDRTVSFNGDISRMFDCTVVSATADNLVSSGLDIATGVSEVAGGLAVGVGISAASMGTATPLGIAAGGTLVAAGGAQIIFGLRDAMATLEGVSSNPSQHNFMRDACNAGFGFGSSMLRTGVKGFWSAFRSLSISAGWSYLKWRNAAYPSYKGDPIGATVKQHSN